MYYPYSMRRGAVGRLYKRLWQLIALIAHKLIYQQTLQWSVNSSLSVMVILLKLALCVPWFISVSLQSPKWSRLILLLSYQPYQRKDEKSPNVASIWTLFNNQPIYIIRHGWLSDYQINHFQLNFSQTIILLGSAYP